jgi:hypothetical protein
MERSDFKKNASDEEEVVTAAEVALLLILKTLPSGLLCVCSERKRDGEREKATESKTEGDEERKRRG